MVVVYSGKTEDEDATAASRDLDRGRTDPPPELWSRKSFGYTLPEEEKDHAKDPKNVHSRV